jgi:hypothetical protein
MLLGEKCECKPIIVLNFCELDRDFRGPETDRKINHSKFRRIEHVAYLPLHMSRLSETGIV